jgi:serine beta-lactamase-like protein LACTB
VKHRRGLATCPVILDAPVQEYCPAFHEKEAPITTRQLLGHLGGIRHTQGSLENPERFNTKRFYDSIAGGLSFFKADPLVAMPGTMYSYSTHSYTLVSCVTEGALDKKYVDFVRENVSRPAGMTQTRIDDRLVIVPHRTRIYSKDAFGNEINAEPVDVNFKAPGGGWLLSLNLEGGGAACCCAATLATPASRNARTMSY